VIQTTKAKNNTKMSDEEILAIVQARIDGKHLEKRNILYRVIWLDVLQTEALNFEKYEYRVKPEDNLPKTWEDYCRVNGVVENYLQCQMPFIGAAKQNGVYSETHVYSDAFVALAKLVILRDYYNKNEKPSHDVLHYICIRNINGKLTVVPVEGKLFSKNNDSYRPQMLRFHTPQLRDTFMENFNDLILEAAEILI
jgi:hypothetical protein